MGALFDPATVCVVVGAFFIAGAVKGVIGLGLPTVSLGLLAAALDLQTAMALLVVPSFVTNLWQSVVGGNAKAILSRLWPFLAAATAYDDGRGTPEASARAKLFATEAAQWVVDQAVQLHGARGLQRGHLLERLYREVRAPRIYEGASEVQRTIIGRALVRSHQQSGGQA